MPRKVTAYACQYRCGHGFRSKKKAIEAHEKTCLRNPARRACVTCQHTGLDMDGYRYWYTCAVGALPEGKDCIVNCPHHTVEEGR